ncbi:IS3 family transposase [Verrucomicrobiota bacterium]
MKKQRRKHSAEFKARVALEALKGLNTINEIAAKFEIHPVQVGTWKKELLERVPEVFERKNAAPDKEVEMEKARLERKEGQLSMEVDWLGKKVRTAGDPQQRAQLVRKKSKISLRRQCDLLGISRSLIYYLPKGESEENLRIMKEIDKLHLEDASAGARRMRDYLRRMEWPNISRGRVKRLMRLMSIDAVYPRKRTTIPGGRSGIYPYRLKGLKIDHPNQVWSADITYIPMARGFMYLFAIIDWHSRKILAWELSNTLDTAFCVRTLNRAVELAGTTPEIFNTDQGCQFTSDEWIGQFKELEVTISMDGKGRWLDNVVIERFWRSLKYEDLYLNSYENGWTLERGIEAYIMRYNLKRPHQSLGSATPEEVYKGVIKLAA